MVYEEVLEDQLDLLYTNYTSDKSQILEIVMINWLQCLNNYKQYPKVIPKVMDMLKHQSVSIEVAGIILTFVKNLILNTLHGEDKKKREIRDIIRKDLDDDLDD